MDCFSALVERYFLELETLATFVAGCGDLVQLVVARSTGTAAFATVQGTCDMET